MRRLIVLAVVLLGRTSLTFAQSSPEATAVRHPLALSAIGGVTAGGDAGGTVGAAMSFQATPRIAVEARGAFIDRADGARAIEATGTMMFTLARQARWAPYAVVGGGLYHADFDLDGGTTGNGLMGGNAAYFMDRFRSDFYRMRLGAMIDGHQGRRSFTDPAAVVGGGVRVDLTSHLFLRPDVRALVVVGRHDTLTMTAMTVAVGYGF